MLQIESSTLALDVLPEVGGKIGQIRDKLSGREFLVAPRKPYRTIPLDGDWLQFDTSGMDDCFPNIAAGPYPTGPWAATQLPDLGGWTHGCWNVIEAGQSRVVLERTGEALPYSVRKTVRFVEECTLEFSYRVQNRGEFPMRYMWSAHPLISVEGPFELRLPAGDLLFRTFPSDGGGPRLAHIRIREPVMRVDPSRHKFEGLYHRARRGLVRIALTGTYAAFYIRLAGYSGRRCLVQQFRIPGR